MKNDIHNERLHTMFQASRTSSPWSRRDHLRLLLWECVRIFLFRSSPRPMHAWRRLLLRTFGCKMTGIPFIQPTAIIKMPWNLTMENGAHIGDRAELYNLGSVTLKANSTIAQLTYLCGGTHDLSTRKSPLIVGNIVVGEDAFIGAHALLLPGVHIGDGAVIGAGSVVTKDMPEWMICAGNPCKPIKPREFNKLDN